MGKYARLLIGLGLVAGLASAAPSPQSPLRSLRWLAAGHDPVRALAFSPRECLSEATDRSQQEAIETGRAVFRSPLILGGQAARAGVSCETCHRNGRDNRDFQFPGISGAAGTADVTSSLFSSHRGNGVEDPRPIPDLSMAKARLKVSQRPEDRALEPFIHGLITQEIGRAHV